MKPFSPLNKNLLDCIHKASFGINKEIFNNNGMNIITRENPIAQL